MQYALVVSKTNKPLMPCHPARARELLKKGKAVVLRRYPFTIKLINRSEGNVQSIDLKIDPGSKTTGIALITYTKLSGLKVVLGINLIHRGHQISQLLTRRAMSRRSRRQRKTRYRKARFLNRTKPKGWFPPSIRSRLDNILQWVYRLFKWSPVSAIAYEHVKFNPAMHLKHALNNATFKDRSIEAYEIKEYLLTKYNYKCVYCDAKDVIFEQDHVVPKSRGGSNRISNLVLACVKCNQAKSNKSLDEFVKDPKRLHRIKSQLLVPLKDMAAVNATRNALGELLLKIGCPVIVGTGGQTKFARVNNNLPKDHWIDAACVAINGAKITVSSKLKPLTITKQRRNNRQMTLMNKYGFPRTKAKGSSKKIFGFMTGDIVKANVSSGKYKGIHLGKVVVRLTGYFDIKKENSPPFTTNKLNCKLIHHFDGYNYN